MALQWEAIYYSPRKSGFRVVDRKDSLSIAEEMFSVERSGELSMPALPPSRAASQSLFEGWLFCGSKKSSGRSGTEAGGSSVKGARRSGGDRSFPRAKPKAVPAISVVKQWCSRSNSQLSLCWRFCGRGSLRLVPDEGELDG